jgi:putative flippase GtrA
MPIALLRDLHARIFVRYLGASAAALAVDVGLFLLLLPSGMPATAASAIGFCAGIAMHWLISSRLVFLATAAPGGIDRWRQKFLFLLSAALGLTLTVGIVAYGAAAGLDPRIAKLIAVVISFTTTYAVRRIFVFAAR